MKLTNEQFKKYEQIKKEFAETIDLVQDVTKTTRIMIAAYVKTNKHFSHESLDQISNPDLVANLQQIGKHFDEFIKEVPEFKEPFNELRKSIYNQSIGLVEKQHILNEDLLNDVNFVVQNIKDYFIYPKSSQRIKDHPQIILKYLDTHKNLDENGNQMYTETNTTSMIRTNETLDKINPKILSNPSFISHLMSDDYFTDFSHKESFLDLNIVATAFKQAQEKGNNYAMRNISQNTQHRNKQILFNEFPSEYKNFPHSIQKNHENIKTYIQLDDKNLFNIRTEQEVLRNGETIPYDKEYPQELKDLISEKVKSLAISNYNEQVEILSQMSPLKDNYSKMMDNFYNSPKSALTEEEKNKRKEYEDLDLKLIRVEKRIFHLLFLTGESDHISYDREKHKPEDILNIILNNIQGKEKISDQVKNDTPTIKFK